MVPRFARGLGELLDRHLGRGEVGVAEAEVDDVLTGAAQLELEPVDLGERVRGQGVDAAKLGHAAVCTCIGCRSR
jgi:hypothetical protein